MHALRRAALVTGVLALVAGPVVLALVPHDPGVLSWYVVGLTGLVGLLLGSTARAPGWVTAAGLYAGAIMAVLLAYGWVPGNVAGYLLLLPVAPAVAVLVGPPAWALMVAGVIAAVLLWRLRTTRGAASPT